MITTKHVNEQQKFISFYSILMLMIVMFCCSLLVLNLNTTKYTTTVQNSNTTALVTKGSVQGVETIASITPEVITTTPVNNVSVPAKYTLTYPAPYKSNSKLVMQGKFPSECGLYCTGTLFQSTRCTTNCEAVDSVILKPDSYGSFSYINTKGVQSGYYVFSLVDASKTKIEDIKIMVL